MAKVNASMCGSLKKNITYKGVLASPAMPHISCLSYLDRFLIGEISGWTTTVLWDVASSENGNFSFKSYELCFVYWYFYFYYYYLLIRVFHISISWWSFTGDWVTANLLKSPGLFSVFWPFSIMLLFGWSPLGHQLFTFFQFYSVVSRDSKVDNFADFLLFVDYYKVWSSGQD